MTAAHVPYEPTAAARQTAAILHDYYAALIAEGFTEPQALTIVGHMLASAKSGGDA